MMGVAITVALMFYCEQIADIAIWSVEGKYSYEEIVEKAHKRVDKIHIRPIHSAAQGRKADKYEFVQEVYYECLDGRYKR